MNEKIKRHDHSRSSASLSIQEYPTIPKYHSWQTFLTESKNIQQSPIPYLANFLTENYPRVSKYHFTNFLTENYPTVHKYHIWQTVWELSNSPQIPYFTNFVTKLSKKPQIPYFTNFLTENYPTVHKYHILQTFWLSYLVKRTQHAETQTGIEKTWSTIKA
jgi:hypothetical protein